MNDHEIRMKLFSLSMEVSSLTFEYSQILTENKILAIKLFGYRARSPEKFPDLLVERMDIYIRSNREKDSLNQPMD
ncbi:MAG: hypothetical protein M1123_05195 [Candidatus Thermoplasmatota archaeon]|nr:hypothetical protein [Candidatus Thermoplasmatota archaeon]